MNFEFCELGDTCARAANIAYQAYWQYLSGVGYFKYVENGGDYENHDDVLCFNTQQGSYGVCPGVMDKPEPSMWEHVSMGPNPTQGKVVVNLGDVGQRTSVSYAVVGMDGRVALTGSTRKGEAALEFDLSSLPQGIYLIRLNAGNEAPLHLRVSVQH